MTHRIAYRYGSILAVFCLLFGAAYAQTPSQITLFGANKYPQDVHAVQDAVDNFDVVTLSGTFNFGDTGYSVTNCETVIGTPKGGVLIRRNNVTLKADPSGHATIIGGGAIYFFRFGFGPLGGSDAETWPAIAINASGVTVQGIRIEGSVDGIFVMAGGNAVSSGHPVTLEGNTISTLSWGVVIAGTKALTSGPGTKISIRNNSVMAGDLAVFSALRGDWPLSISNNNLTSGSGCPSGSIYDEWVGYTIDQTGQPVASASPLEIINNDIRFTDVNPNAGADVITINGWNVSPLSLPSNFAPAESNPDWGDNGPVKITSNTITANEADFGTAVISLGRSGQGLNHSVTSNNILLGTAFLGIAKWPYGHDNIISENDLSGLTTNTIAPQILVLARDTTVEGNVLGPSPGFPALWLVSQNIHPLAYDPLDTPMPLPVQHCTIANNDYRLAQCVGWSQGNGCILITSDADWSWYGYGVGTEVRNNFIDETSMFPNGTGGPSNQIYELQVGSSPLVHDNRIIGLPAKDVSVPGIGQRLKQTRNYPRPFEPLPLSPWRLIKHN